MGRTLVAFLVGAAIGAGALGLAWGLSSRGSNSHAEERALLYARHTAQRIEPDKDKPAVTVDHVGGSVWRMLILDPRAKQPIQCYTFELTPSGLGRDDSLMEDDCVTLKQPGG